MKAIYKLIILLSILFAFNNTNAQKKIYDHMADADQVIEKAIQKAKAENKHVLIKLGGNWCKWCIKLHEFCHDSPRISYFIDTYFVETLVAISNEKRNDHILKKYKNPGRFGYPVLLILDGEGNLIHTQDIAPFEKGNSGEFDEAKLTKFFKNWTPEALKFNQ